MIFESQGMLVTTTAPTKNKVSFTRKSVLPTGPIPTPRSVVKRSGTYSALEAPTTTASDAHMPMIKALSNHAFFRGLGHGVIESFARSCQRREYIPRGTKISEGNSIAVQVSAGIPIITENTADLNADFLWVIESGTVTVEESGQVMGKLKGGNVFGEAVAFGLTEEQPFTVKCSEDPLSVLCIPNASISPITVKFVCCRCEGLMWKQWKRLFLPRVKLLNFFSHCCSDLIYRFQNKFQVKMLSSGDLLCMQGCQATSALLVVRGTMVIQPVQNQNTPKARKSIFSARPKSFRVTSQELEKQLLSSRIKAARAKYAEDTVEIDECDEDCVQTDGSMHGVWSSGNWREEEVMPDMADLTTTIVEAGSDSSDWPSTSSEGEDDKFVSSRTPSKTGNADSSDEDSFESNSNSDIECPLSRGNVDITLPRHLACLEPEMSTVTASANGSGALLFNDSVLLGFETTATRTVYAKSCCMVFELNNTDFLDSIKSHKESAKHFLELERQNYREWMKCQVASIHRIPMFSRSRVAVLESLVADVLPQLYFRKDDIIPKEADTQDLYVLTEGKAYRANVRNLFEQILAPHTFGSLQWLGAVLKMRQKVVAKTLCQVLVFSRDHLISTLTRFPDEGVTIANAVRTHNGSQLSLVVSKPKELKCCTIHMWYLAFLRGCDPAFIENFADAIERVKLSPGSPLIRTEGDSDFIAIALEGHVDIAEKNASNKILQAVAAPFLLCGFDRTRSIQTFAQNTCKVQRMTIKAASELASKHPDSMRRVLDRFVVYQVRSHIACSVKWWSPEKSLQALPPFEDSSPEFLNQASLLLESKIVLPGEAIVEEGETVDSTLILECGHCKIEKRTLKAYSSVEVVALISDGHWIGGVGGVCGFAGELKRKATVRAVTVCKVHHISTPRFIELLGSMPLERQSFRAFAEPELRSKDNDRLEDHLFFKSLPRQFLNTLRPKCRVHVFFANERLVTQGEVAESMMILSAESSVVIELDGKRTREINGRHCLGTLALLRQRPPRRTATVYTQTACAVRVLTREDWQDALKLYPEHRDWIDEFTEEQEALVADVRQSLMKRRAWERIQVRDAQAQKTLYQRTRGTRITTLCEKSKAGCLDFIQERGKTPRRTLAYVERKYDHRRVGKCSKHIAFCEESWQCFNNEHVIVPSLKLPQLNPFATKNASDAFSDVSCSSSDGNGSPKDDVRRLKQARNSVFNSTEDDGWRECDRAIGLNCDTLAYRTAHKNGQIKHWF